MLLKILNDWRKRSLLFVFLAFLQTIITWFPFGKSIVTILAVDYPIKSLPPRSDFIIYFGQLLGVENALADGQIVPQLSTLNAPVGNPTIMFYGVAQSAVYALMHFLTQNISITLNFLSLITVFITLCTAYEFAKYLFRKKPNQQHMALLSAFFYLCGPIFVYNFLNCISGVQSGSVFAYPFYPLFFLSLFRILDQNTNQTNNQKNVISLSVSAVIILLTHSLSFYIICLYVVAILAISFRQLLSQKVLIHLTISACLFLLLSAFYWLPMVEIAHADYFYFFKHVSYFPSFLQDHKVNWFNPDHNIDLFDALFFDFVVICGFIFWVRNRKMPQFQNLRLFVLVILAMVATFWYFPFEKLPNFILRLQFPDRLLMVGYVFLGPLIVMIICKIYCFCKKKFMKVAVVTIAVIMSFGLSIAGKVFYNYFRHDNIHMSITEQNIDEWQIGTTANEYQSVKALEYNDVLGHNINNIDQNALPFEKDYQQKGTHITFTARKDQNTYYFPNTYFPGYKAKDQNGNPLQISMAKEQFLQINTPPNYSGEVGVYYGLSQGTLIGLILSLLTALGLILLRLRLYFQPPPNPVL